MRQKLNDLIDSGADIEFSCRGVAYTILPWTDDGIAIGVQGAEDDSNFKDADSLFVGYKIDDVPIGQMMDEIRLEFSS